MEYISIKRKTLFIIAVLCAAFIISTVFCFMQGNVRRVFLFDSVDSSVEHVESRYLPKCRTKSENIRLFIDELLLGSFMDRSRPLFAAGAKILSCYLRDNTLYLDLSSEALLADTESSETKRAYQLLKKNVKLNFRGVKKYKVFIKGNEIFTENFAAGL